MRVKLQQLEAERLAAPLGGEGESLPVAAGLGAAWGRKRDAGGGGTWDDVSSSWGNDNVAYVDPAEREAARARDAAAWADGIHPALLARMAEAEAAAAAGEAPPLPPDPFEPPAAPPEVGAAAAVMEDVAPAYAMNYLPQFSLEHTVPEHEPRCGRLR